MSNDENATLGQGLQTLKLLLDQGIGLGTLRILHEGGYLSVVAKKAVNGTLPRPEVFRRIIEQANPDFEIWCSIQMEEDLDLFWKAAKKRLFWVEDESQKELIFTLLSEFSSSRAMINAEVDLVKVSPQMIGVDEFVFDSLDPTRSAHYICKKARQYGLVPCPVSIPLWMGLQLGNHAGHIVSCDLVEKPDKQVCSFIYSRHGAGGHWVEFYTAKLSVHDTYVFIQPRSDQKWMF